MSTYASPHLAIVRRLLLALFSALAASAASADPILTGSSGRARVTLDFFGAGLPSQIAEQTFEPFGGAAVAEVGRNRAVQTGAGLNAVNVEGRLSDVPGFQFRAETDIDWRIENTGSDAQDLIFDYTINGGQLRLFDPSGSFQDLRSTVGVSIFTIGTDFSGFLWEWGVSLHGTSPGVVEAEVHGFSHIFDFDDPLGLGSPVVSAVTISGDEAVVSIAPFTATVNLGRMNPGDSSSISYSMFGQVSGPALRFSGGSATVGDPFNLQGAPGSVLSFKGGTATVPEPSSLALLGAGLAVLLRRSRAAQRSSATQKTASGLSGEPIPFSMRSGAAMNRNS
jgi:hypothetical protein